MKITGSLGPAGLQMIPQFNSRRASELDVHSKTIDPRDDTTREKSLCRRKHFGNKAICVQQFPHRAEDIGIVIDDRHCNLSFMHDLFLIYTQVTRSGRSIQRNMQLIFGLGA